MMFAEKFCAVRQIDPKQYEGAVLRLALRPAASWLRPVLALYPGYFTADLELVRGVGRIRRLRDFEGEAADFAHHPENRGFFRRALLLRVSVQRLRRLVRTTLHDNKPSAEPVNRSRAGGS